MAKIKKTTSPDNRQTSGENQPALPDPAMDMLEFLLALPATNINVRRFSKDEMHVRIPIELSAKLRFVMETISIIEEPQSFRLDSLVNYLLEQFLLTNRAGLESLLKQGKTVMLERQRKSQQVLDNLISSLKSTDNP